MGGDEDLFNFLGYSFDIAQVGAVRQFLHQLLGIEAALFGCLFEKRIDLDQMGAVQDILGKTEGEKGLDAARTAGDNAQRAGGSDGGAGGISELRGPSGTS